MGSFLSSPHCHFFINSFFLFLTSLSPLLSFSPKEAYLNSFYSSSKNWLAHQSFSLSLLSYLYASKLLHDGPSFSFYTAAWSRSGVRLEERGQCRPVFNPVFTIVDVSMHGSRVCHVWGLEGGSSCCKRVVSACRNGEGTTTRLVPGWISDQPNL